MLIIWRGQGIVVAIIMAVCLLIGDFSTSRYFHDPDYYATHGWAQLAAFLVAAVAVRLLYPRPKKDPDYEKMEFLRGQAPPPAEDALFLIPNHYWPYILCGLGVVFGGIAELVRRMG